MKRKRYKVLTMVLLVVMAISMFFSSVVTYAASLGGAGSFTNLVTTLKKGSYTYGVEGKLIDFTKKSYDMQGGGYMLYGQLWNTTTDYAKEDLFTTDFRNLKLGAKKDFLTDVFTLANAIADDTENGKGTNGADSPSADTVNMLMEKIQTQSGLGSTMLAAILQNTKPDYITANRLYQPFSGVVGTILGIISVLIMALLGVTMALDLAYITIPAFQMALGGDGDGSAQGQKKGLSRIISTEAHKAIQAADGGSGGQAGDGSYKAAVGIYFKYRWKGLTLLGICLLYLVQGQLYSFVGWFVDLFSGFLGF